MPTDNEYITCNIAMHIFILKLLKSTNAFMVEKAFQIQNHLLDPYNISTHVLLQFKNYTADTVDLYWSPPTDWLGHSTSGHLLWGEWLTNGIHKSL